jgi:hypothetical protein
VSYDGVELRFQLDGVEVARHPLPGFRITASKRDLHIGSYSQGQQTFAGSIRNVRLSVLKPVSNQKGLIVVSDFGKPKIDGDLDEATWKAATFFSGFSDFSIGWSTWCAIPQPHPVPGVRPEMGPTILETGT